MKSFVKTSLLVAGLVVAGTAMSATIIKGLQPASITVAKGLPLNTGEAVIKDSKGTAVPTGTSALKLGSPAQYGTAVCDDATGKAQYTPGASSVGKSSDSFTCVYVQGGLKPSARVTVTLTGTTASP